MDAEIDGDKQEREDRKRAALIADLIRTPAWKMLSDLLVEKQSGYGNELLTEPGKGNDLSPQRDWWLKGAMFSLAYVIDLPGVIVAATDKSAAAELEDEP